MILCMKRLFVASACFYFIFTFPFLSCLHFFTPTPAQAADFEFTGKIDARDATSRLLAHYAERFTPEELYLLVDEPPDETGNFRDIYMDLTGVLIGGVRVDKLTFKMVDARFNAPSEWEAGSVECLDALQVYALCVLREDDVNQRLATEAFGGNDNWRNISMKISPAGFYAKGNYVTDILFFSLNILIEVESDLKIVANQELWLDRYKFRVNRLDVPDYITRKAIDQIQPLLDLGRVPLPLKLHNVEFQDGQVVLSTRVLPEPAPGGFSYHYRKE
ncbi:MAG: DUF2993 domain-containing protein [Synergistaceae bacterium]|nr:DUF2993 domain-containing protein [Synergistaceae bacterium]